MSDWSDESVSLLRTLKAQGYSASHISRMLRATGLKVSRSAVIGKCFRLGLNEPDKSPARIAARLQSARVRRYGAEVAEKRRRDKKALSVASAPAPYRPSKTPPASDRPNAVRFIAINQWCSDCAKLVYQPIEKRKAA